MRATVSSLREVRLPTVEVEVAEWNATVLLQCLTRAQVRECREHATGEDRKLDLDAYDLAVLATCITEPDLLVEMTLGEAVELLRAQPVGLVWRLVREAVSLSGLAPDSPFRRRERDDAERRTVPGTSDTPRSGRDDPDGDASENVPA